MHDLFEVACFDMFHSRQMLLTRSTSPDGAIMPDSISQFGNVPAHARMLCWAGLRTQPAMTGFISPPCSGSFGWVCPDVLQLFGRWSSELNL